MLAIERKNEILSILQKEQRVLVAELSTRYHVTEETIRRDLEKLEKEGFVKKKDPSGILMVKTDTVKCEPFAGAEGVGLKDIVTL